MAVEIERKFLLNPNSTLPDSDRVQHIRQFYLNEDDTLSVRVRIVEEERAYLTIKKVKGEQLSVRNEFEYEIPVADALEMQECAVGVPIVKNRHIIHTDGHQWEVDFFEDENEGLILVEVELETLDAALALPNWVGKEVSNDPRYLNNQLARTPYKLWAEE